MAGKKRSENLSEGKDRLEEIGHRLGNLFGHAKPGASGGGGVFAGLGTLIEQLGHLAEQAEKSGGEVNRSGEIDTGSNKSIKAVYGLSVRSGLGESKPKVEPFGNVRRDSEDGKVTIHEIREPMVDVFDESDYLLVIAEVPGIKQDDVHLDLHEDILVLAAESGDKKYRKEILLPASFAPERMSFTCRNGVLEIRFLKEKAGS
jgi:HSP20 family protein